MKIAGIKFDHFHMGDLLRYAFNHPQAEIVGLCDEDPARMQDAAHNFNVPGERLFTDYRACVETTKPDVVILCPAPARHAEYVEALAPYGVHLLVEKPMAASLADADAMMRALAATGRTLMINWPMVWSPPHRTAQRLLGEGLIGDVREVHYYGGNRGPLYHGADKVEVSAEEVQRRKPHSWFYAWASGGGSLRDYLGYGVTLGTWFHNGAVPLEVTAVVDEPAGLEVDEHSLTIARYATGLSKFETRWGTFTDPWTHQPQPKCGFVIVGSAGTLSSYDSETTIRVQTKQAPAGYEVSVDTLAAPHSNPIEHLLHHLTTGAPLLGPLTPALSRLGQQIVETAIVSAREKRAVRLVE
ncbi:MAG: Gfo/Idh/MocA family oxidoreductase [Acidobacteria bacterium]|nr:Gfo/Idh/MocA family oxidoreductase [Acidobacteriota bacterium]MBI3427227.1 Gfo/Idh/MocA family oxidoreductase [Acidobacteriota bacterium]